MPKEQRKRGRREEKKRKFLDHEQNQENASFLSKRPKLPSGSLDESTRAEGYPQYLPSTDEGSSGVLPFYGLLDEEEQGYFKRADTLLELNQFANTEERELFLENVYREATGKELKIANSQSCSRFMERLIRISTPKQVKALFQKFSGHFLNLVQHRFASHCCETLFIQAAPVITYELTALGNEFEQADLLANDQVSMEYLYLSAVRELEGSLGYLMMDKFASHTLRVLLLVLAGRPLSNTATLVVLQGKTKDIGNAGTQISALPPELFEMRSVPGSFGTVLDDFVSGTTAGLDTTYLQALAMHPTGNPVLQLLLELEFNRAEKSTAQDANSLIRRLIPDDPPVDGTQSSSFINGLLYDPVGSRLLETIVQHAPGKLFKSLYRHLFRKHLGKFAKNEVAGFIAIKLLERLSRADLENAVEQLLPLLPLLLERSRISVIKAMIERCQVRQIAIGDVAQALQAVSHRSEPSGLFNVLKLAASHTEGMSNDRKSWIERRTNERAHASILVQTMTASPGPLRDIVIDDILKMNSPSLLAMAKDRTTTHIIQQLLICADQTKPFRKKIMQLYYGHLAEMALDPIASHVVDTFWTATHDLLFVRETVAEELLKSEPALRESISGRAVLKNWRMDLYKRRRVEWIAEAKGLSRAKAVKDTERASYSVVSSGSNKSAIQLARERFAATKVQVGVHTISDLGNTT